MSGVLDIEVALKSDAARASCRSRIKVPADMERLAALGLLQREVALHAVMLVLAKQWAPLRCMADDWRIVSFEELERSEVEEGLRE